MYYVLHYFSTKFHVLSAYASAAHWAPQALSSQAVSVFHCPRDTDDLEKVTGSKVKVDQLLNSWRDLIEN